MVGLKIILNFLLFVNMESVCKMISEIHACHDGVSSDRSSHIIWTLVDVTVGATISMQCQFCNKKDDYLGKLWHYLTVLNNFTREEINLKETINYYQKTTILLNHTMKLHNFSISDSGIYYCQYYDTRKRNIFVYILDTIFLDTTKIRTGTLSQWIVYRKYYLDSINSKFKRSLEEPFLSLRDKYYSHIQAITVWDSWEQCKPLNNRQGIRKRRGRCRIQVQPSNIKYSTKVEFVVSQILNYGFEFQMPQDILVSCRSVKLHQFLNRFGFMLNNTPDYEAWEPCFIPITEKNNYIDDSQSEITKQVAENSFLTLTCQKAIPDSRIIWYRNKKIMDSMYGIDMADSNEEPHIIIDAYNMLHLLHVTKNEEGNYTCLVDGRLLHKYIVKVLSKTVLLNQEFIRYSLYLGFVLSLTLSCYCTGVCVAWHRKSSFADPLNWNNKNKYHQLQGNL